MLPESVGAGRYIGSLQEQRFGFGKAYKLGDEVCTQAEPSALQAGRYHADTFDYQYSFDDVPRKIAVDAWGADSDGVIDFVGAIYESVVRF